MVAVGIAAILVTGTVSVLNLQAQGLRTTKVSQDVETIVTLTKYALADRATCTLNKSKFTGTISPTATLPSNGFDYAGGLGPIVTVTAVADPANVTVEKIEAYDFVSLSTVSAGTPQERKVWNGKVLMHVRRPGAIGAQVVKREFPIQFLSDAAGVIQNCSANEATIASTCMSLGGTIDSAGNCIASGGGGTGPTLAAVCSSLGGTFDSVSAKCTGVGGGGGGSGSMSCTSVGNSCDYFGTAVPPCPSGYWQTSVSDSTKYWSYGCSGGISVTCCTVR